MVRFVVYVVRFVVYVVKFVVLKSCRLRVCVSVSLIISEKVATALGRSYQHLPNLFFIFNFFCFENYLK